MKKKVSDGPSAEIDTRRDITLVVARSNGKKMVGWRVEMHEDVVTAVRAQCEATLANISSRTPVEFSPDMQLGINNREQYLLVPDISLEGEVSPPGSGAPEAKIELSRQLLDVLSRAPSLDQISSQELPKSGFQLYAAVLGDGAGAKAAFVCKANPQKSLSSGGMFGTFHNKLKKITDPVFILRPQFHLGPA